MFKRLFIVSLTLVLSSFFINAEETSLSKPKVAVLDFQTIGESDKENQLGIAVAENLRTSLIDTNEYQVIERSSLSRILDEQKLQSAGILDQSQAVELGKLVGAEKMVLGSITKIGDTYTLNVRFIDMKTGVANTAKKIQGKSQNDIPRMIDDVVKTLTKKSTIEAISAPVEVSKTQIVSPESKPYTTVSPTTTPTQTSKPWYSLENFGLDDSKAKYGIKLHLIQGYPSNKSTTLSTSDIKPVLSFGVSGFFDYSISNSFYLRPELSYISKKSTYYTHYTFYDFDSFSFDSTYLELTTFLKWKLKEQDSFSFSLLSGIGISLLLNSSTEAVDNYYTYSYPLYSYSSDYKRVLANISLGIEVQKDNYIANLSTKIESPFVSVSNNNSPFELNYITPSLSLGYMF